MFDNGADTGSTSRNDFGSHKPYEKSLDAAVDAEFRGNEVEAMHLYLTAFEQASAGNDGEKLEASHPALEGLRKAWSLAYDLKERSLAEYALEKLTPYLAPDELGADAAKLQELAIGKLEDFGLSKEQLQNVASMIGEDFDHLLSGGDIISIDPTSGSIEHTHVPHVSAQAKATKTQKPKAQNPSREEHGYHDLVGYSNAIAAMRARGIGFAHDAAEKKLVHSLNEHHGMDSVPWFDTFVFSAPSHEDAATFMEATAYELAMPVVKFKLDSTNPMLPVLSVTTTSDIQAKMSGTSASISGPAVVMLYDIDEWGSPVMADLDDMDMMALSQISRGARQAVSFIRDCVQRSDIAVLASTSSTSEVDPFFADLLGTIDDIEVGTPDLADRDAIWTNLVSAHPSLSHVDRCKILQMSDGISRTGLYWAARDAVEESYRNGLSLRTYTPVQANEVLEKIALYLPISSNTYARIEDLLVAELRHDLDNLDSQS